MVELTIRSLAARGVEVPLRRALGTSQAAIRKAPLLLLDLETEEGVTGRAYLFCYVPAAAPALASLLGEALGAVKGDRVAPVDLAAKLARRFTLVGVTGLVRMALSGLDAACWDALAIAAGRPLASLLGGAPRPIPAYNSNGLSLQPVAALEREAEELAEGFRAVKLRLGYPTLEADLVAVRAVRRRLPGDVVLLVDYNQALSVADAVRRGRALDGEGVEWIEEPVRHDDYRGCAEVARQVATAVQLGENFSGPEAMADALAQDACDLVMPDLGRIGGVTGWQRAAALASARRVGLSSHLYPEVSAQLLAASPTAHWLEYVDWADAVLAEPLRVVEGSAAVSDRPGSGLAWDEDAVARLRVC